ncbi:MAG: site-2 protease family protein [bacterium]|nr:site-2 protease family protein [bacterium]
MSILIFIVVLLLLVLVHEFGHFIVAKKAGISVDEFAFGFPPKIWSRKYGETTYALNALPLGGYVKIYGENPNDVKGEDRLRSFVAQPRLVQAAVIVAGIIFNLLFAWFLFAAAFMIGVPSPEGGGEGYPVKNLQLTITGTGDGSPAVLAGLASGDVLKKLSVEGTEQEVTNADQVIAFIAPREGQTITLSYERDGEERAVAVVPVSGIVPDVAAIGIYMDTIGTLQLPPHIALWEGLQKTYQFTVMTAVGIFQFLSEALTGQSDFEDVAGPVGIVKEVGNAAGLGFANLILFTALISINLAVINIIPFPALDGGRLLFIVIERIMRRPIKPAIANAFNAVGFALLMLLMVAVTYHDVMKLI